MTINDRISKILEYSQLTSSEFADAVEVQRSSISHITSGRNKPSLDFLMKVKSHFPELEWDWLITGNGEMLIKDTPVAASEPEPVKQVPTSLPDLFSLLDDDNFGNTESEDRIQKKVDLEQRTETVLESPAQHQNNERGVLDDSQPLEQKATLQNNQVVINQQDNVKRIVLFYESGKFESFEP